MPAKKGKTTRKIVVEDELEEIQDVQEPAVVLKKTKKNVKKNVKTEKQSSTRETKEVKIKQEEVLNKEEESSSVVSNGECINIEEVKLKIEDKFKEIRNVMTSENIDVDLQRGLKKCQITALRRLRSKLEHIKKEAHSTKKLILNVMKDKKKQQV